MTHTTRTACTLAAAALVTLTACNPTTNNNNANPTPTTTIPTNASDSNTPNPATQTPEQRIRAYFQASDKAAANGWKDSTYATEYLTPEIAKAEKADDAERAKSGAKTSGERELTQFSLVEESNKKTVIEFCSDTTKIKATIDGKPVKVNNNTESVARFTLTRESASKPWMISEKGWYEKKEVGSCAEYFGE